MTSLLTASRINCLLACPRRHFWRYEIGMKPRQSSDALRFGSAWHRAMEARWRGADFQDALASALPENVDLEPLAAHTVTGLLAAYYQHHGERDQVVKEIHPEVEFRHKLTGSRSFDVAGKIDGLAVLHDGRIALIEHKTTADSVEPDSDYWDRLRFNPQILQYVDSARALGWGIEVVIYDVARKPMIRQKQTETVEQFGDRLHADAMERPAFYFARREVPILEDDLAEFRAQRLVMGRHILSCRAEERAHARRERAWPRNINTIACRSCEFSSFCLQNSTINPEQPPAGFVVGNAHEELTTT
jgi:hypothetical protein